MKQANLAREIHRASHVLREALSILLFAGGCVALVFLHAAPAAACTLTMGYRTNARLPLIAEAPDNTGLYHDLYKRASEKIGCNFNIIREPKNRTLRRLEEGTIDFYPGFDFTKERAEYTFYIENGLPGGYVGISRLDIANVTNLEQLRGIVLLEALGSAEYSGKIPEVEVVSVPDMDMEKAVTLLRRKRADFYIYNKETIDYYTSKNEAKDIRIHPDCCGGIKSHYLGFSRKSPHFGEVPNAGYDPSKEMSPENFPTVLAENSIAHKLAVALREMKQTGETGQLYKKYYR